MCRAEQGDADGPSFQQFERVNNALTLLKEEVAEEAAATSEGFILRFITSIVNVILIVISIITSALTFGEGGAVVASAVIAAGAVIGATSKDIQNTGIDIDLSNLISLVDEVELAIAENDASALLFLRDSLIEATMDIDGDGVPNDEDDCPFVPGSAKLNGCPF